MTVTVPTIFPPRRECDPETWQMLTGEVILAKVAAIHEVLTAGSPTDRTAMYKQDLLRLFTVREAFFRSLERGARLRPEVVAGLAVQPYAKNLPQHWYEDAFDDDVNFSPERFYLTVAAMDHAETAWQHAALAQGLRLLAAGRVDAAYLMPLTKLTIDAATGIEIVLLAHSDEEYKQLAELATMAQRVNTPGVQARYGDAPVRLAEAMTERERLFAERWLDAMLPSGEAAQVGHVHPVLLRTLYATQWERGYEGYRDAVGAAA